MKTLLIVSGLLFRSTPFVHGQSAVDTYLETGKTIVAARCLSVGPVNKLLRAKVRVDILHVVQGKERLREITIVSHVGMKSGGLYLLRTEYEANEAGDYFTTKTFDSVVPISSEDEVEKLKELSPRIVVLRSMNIRSNAIESKIRSLQFELDSLKMVRSEN